MKSVTIQLPDNIEISEQDLKIRVAARLYEERKISLGEGAIIAGVSKRFFVESLGKIGISIFNYNPDELLEEVRNA